ncbi:MAG: methyltransferase type 11 [Phycisphaeraceae bacterium]|nr:methyltransferase type 11 [Phycisphaeraceae bacterium]
MSSHRTPEYWQDRYVRGDMPWDIDAVSPDLVAVVDDLALAPGTRVLEVGCGTGINTIWMAQRGFDALGIDVAPRAIELASARREALASEARFERADFLAGQSFQGSFGLIFDRGCFHSFEPKQRDVFAGRVHDALAPDGHWLTLCGNADEKRPEGAKGPPQLTAAQVVDAVEANFVILALRQCRFGNADEHHMSWSCLMRRRP